MHPKLLEITDMLQVLRLSPWGKVPICCCYVTLFSCIEKKNLVLMQRNHKHAWMNVKTNLIQGPVIVGYPWISTIQIPWQWRWCIAMVRSIMGALLRVTIRWLWIPILIPWRSWSWSSWTTMWKSSRTRTFGYFTSHYEQIKYTQKNTLNLQNQSKLLSLCVNQKCKSS